jgi:two-component system LytT family response regulator
MRAPITTLIVDDEPIARAGLRDMLAGVDWVTCVGEAVSGPAAVEAINRLRPELVFLDVQMPGMLGTDVVRTIEHQPFVVFTTAYAQHAVTAFELGALDYLLKPFGNERLLTTLERIRAAFGEPSATSSFDRAREALSTGPMSRLFVRSGRSIVPILVANVSWFEALGDYVAAHVDGRKHVLHLSLNRLETRLDPARFARIHRTHIVNLDRVAAFKRVGKDRLVAEMKDGTRLAVSRQRAQEVRGLVEA